ncbi:MAG TPA: hypothetical protein VNX60_13590 [Candidatus Acidoferrum sp.]|nr:hypothetical protein [Candidatus Acidoferrum sp.]
MPDETSPFLAEAEKRVFYQPGSASPYICESHSSHPTKLQKRQPIFLKRIGPPPAHGGPQFLGVDQMRSDGNSRSIAGSTPIRCPDAASAALHPGWDPAAGW